MDKNKNVLMILYYFPPIAGSGVQRSLKFTKYLSQFGYTPIVETVKNGHNYAYDYTLLKELDEDIRIYRSNSGETLWLRNSIEKISSILKRIKKEKNSNEDKNAEVKTSPGLKQKIFDFIERELFIPDSKIRWYRHSVRDVKKILKQEEIHCIYSSSSPYTDHLIALKAKKDTNLPWIADFRDPWVGNGILTKNHSQKRIKKEEELEREVVKYADKVLMVTEPITQMYKERYPEYASKFHTITNGFDEQDFLNIKPIEEDKFCICYSGLLSSDRNPETVILALEKLYKENEKAREDIYIKFIGYIVDEYKSMIEESSINKYAKFFPYMTHDDCIKHMKAAAINLMILEDSEESKGVFSGKIFDYVGAEKPILGILPQGGVAAEVINNRNIGYTYNHGNVEEVYNFIKNIYDKWQKGENLNTNAIEKCQEYRRIYLTSELAKLFDEITK